MLAYIKPKIILLDDDQSLLDVIYYYFTEQFKRSVEIKAFSKSHDFLSHLEKHCYLPESPLEIINTFYKNEINKEQIIKTLKDLSELSAIIVLDQELRGEGITGIEISKTVRDYYPNSYISMLTSNIPVNKAIQLHNDHNIDLFVDKKDPDAIYNLYSYLSRQINITSSQHTVDPVDIFSYSEVLDSNRYILNRNTLTESVDISCFLTINENGDIAIMSDSGAISFWQYDLKDNNFIAYEY